MTMKHGALLSIMAAVALLVGCRTTDLDGPTTTGASNAGATQFKVMDAGMIMGGQWFPGKRGQVIGTLTVSAPDRKVFWNGEELIQLGGHAMDDDTGVRFFSKVRGAVISAGRSKFRIGGPGSLSMTTHWQGVGMEIITKGKADPALDELLAHFQPEAGVIDLFAGFKVIDGQFIPVGTLTYLGKLAITPAGVKLDGRPALMTLVRDGGAAIGLWVRAGEQNLYLWASGGWFLFSGRDTSLGASGTSPVLARLYLALREQAVSGPADDGPQLPSEVRRRATPL